MLRMVTSDIVANAWALADGGQLPGSRSIAQSMLAVEQRPLRARRWARGRWHACPAVGAVRSSNADSTLVNRSLDNVRPAARPLRAASDGELQSAFREALARSDAASAAHCIHETWMRGADGDRIERALASLWTHAATSIPEWLPMHYVAWLPLVYNVAARFAPARHGRTNIYLVSLDYSDRAHGLQGIYVGMTAHRPAQRFDQHRAGVRAAASVLKRGQELLIGPVLHLQRIARADAVRVERELAVALGAAGLIVEGGH
jgi:hypothetical protein